MNEKLFPVSFTKPLHFLTYNEQKEWWEGEAEFGKFAFWIEPDLEKRVYNCNFFTINKDSVLEPLNTMVKGVFISPLGDSMPICGNNKKHFVCQPMDLSTVISEKDDVYGCSLAFWFPTLSKSIFVVSERPELVQYIRRPVDPEALEAARLKLEQWNREREARKQEAKERKEQTEQDWEEWEKRQAADDEK